VSGSVILDGSRDAAVVPADVGREPASDYDAAGRPTRAIPIPQLIRLSLYWLGLSAIWAGVDNILTGRIEYTGLVAKENVGAAYAQMTIAGSIVAILVQPTIATISDYTSSRWGRRKPYIVIGSSLDLVFLYGLASSNTVLSIAVMIALLQFSANFAQGPFQGYIPDLVPEKQVGLASSLMGLFQTLGNATGYILAVSAVAAGQFGVGLMALGVIEFVTMLSVVLRVSEGRRPKERAGRSWLSIALEAWGTDILRERSYLWLVASRLFILMAASSILRFVPNFYLHRVFGIAQDDVVGRYVASAILVVGMVLTVIPAGRASDRFGRRPVIWVSCAAGAVGMALIAIAPLFPVAVLGVLFAGIAGGAFLAVDWALMTDIIPKASSGRYMGISNLATGSAGLFMSVVGGLVMDAVGAALGLDIGARAVFAVCIVIYALGALLLIPVDPRPRVEALETAPA
jgi:MFS family permease